MCPYKIIHSYEEFGSDHSSRPRFYYVTVSIIYYLSMERSSEIQIGNHHMNSHLIAASIQTVEANEMFRM